MRTATFLQARLLSSRLPRKALLPLAGVSVVEHAMRALQRLDTDVHALLTDVGSVDELSPLAAECDFELFAGPEEDVLGRFAMAARHYGADRIVRATGDNPLVSCELAASLLELHERVGADLSGYDGPPLGTGVEIIEAPALFSAERESSDSYEHEHVCPFIYRRPDRFLVCRPQAPARFCFPEALVTLDTAADYRLLAQIFDSLYTGSPIETPALVSWLKEHDEVLKRPAIYTFSESG